MKRADARGGWVTVVLMVLIVVVAASGEFVAYNSVQLQYLEDPDGKESKGFLQDICNFFLGIFYCEAERTAYEGTLTQSVEPNYCQDYRDDIESGDPEIVESACCNIPEHCEFGANLEGLCDGALGVSSPDEPDPYTDTDWRENCDVGSAAA